MARLSMWSIADRERIARFAKEHGVTATARRYGVHESTVREWRAKLRRGEPFFPGIPDMMEALYAETGR